MKLLVIGLIVVIAGLGIWRVMAGRVDLKDPDAVATAFVKTLKTENVKKASAYWVPEHADAWAASATKTMGGWQSGSYVRFFESIPKNPTFTKVHGPKSPANEQTMNADGISLDIRQLDGKWYVCKAPL